jgi:hypothetical protein
MTLRILWIGAFGLTVSLCACGGGDGSAIPPAAAGIAAGTGPTNTALGTVNGQSASVALPAAAGGSPTVRAQLLAALPAGLPTVQSQATEHPIV